MLTQFYKMDNMPYWIMCGDFNIISNDKEKNKGETILIWVFLIDSMIR